MIKVGIIDTDEQVRAAIKRVLIENCVEGKTIPVTILFDVANCSLVLDEEAPDALLLDIVHQDPMIIEKMKKIFPQTEIIVLTHLCDVKTVRKTFRSGAVSYVLKDSCMPYLIYAVMISLNQGSYISPTINRALINLSLSSKQYEDLLTARELQIANGIMDGLSYKMIAEHYDISLDTVRIYIKRVYRKLNINSKGELMAHLSA
jgi:DNA-binding NarL/FixJ family response regulator